MSLWRYHSEEKMQPFSFHKESVAADAYICCPGPSLRYLDPKSLDKPGVLTVALNNAYPYIRPDIWFGMDAPECYSREIFWESFIKIMRGGLQNELCEGRRLGSCFNLYFADCEEDLDNNRIFDFNSEDTVFLWRNNVMVTALHIIMWMGVKRIHLIGCDFSLEKGNYHNKKINLSIENKAWNTKLYEELNNFWKWFAESSPKHGVEVISCTPDSKVNEYLPYLPVSLATERSHGLHNIPFGGKLSHVRDVKK